MTSRNQVDLVHRYNKEIIGLFYTFKAPYFPWMGKMFGLEKHMSDSRIEISLEPFDHPQ